jgi:hypothetical protein
MRAWGKGPMFPYLIDLKIPHAVALAVNWAKERSWHGWDVAHGVNPRESKKGRPLGYKAIVLDLDSMEEARIARLNLANRGWRPSVEIASGRGMHFYLILNRIYPEDKIRPIAREICKCSGGCSVFDASRILRTPGTMNYKPEVMAECRIVEVRGDLLAIDPLDLEVAFPASREVILNDSKCASEYKITPKIQALLDGNYSGYMSRSEAVMAVARYLERTGISIDRAKYVMLNSTLKARGEADITRCLEKCYQSPMSVKITKIKIVSIVVLGSGYKIKFEIIDNPSIHWWQPISEDRLPELVRCFGLFEEDKIGEVDLRYHWYSGKSYPYASRFMEKVDEKEEEGTVE